MSGLIVGLGLFSRCGKILIPTVVGKGRRWCGPILRTLLGGRSESAIGGGGWPRVLQAHFDWVQAALWRGSLGEAV